MASSTPKTIMLSDEPPFVRKERQANNVAITPGDLIEPSGTAQVILHATQGGDARRWFAVENPWAADNSAAAIDTDYAVADNVFFIKGQAGQQVYAWLEPGGSVAVNTFLQSAGSMGALEALAAGTALLSRRLIGFALETVDNSAGTVNARIKVELV